MTAGDLAAIIVTFCVILAMTALMLVLWRLIGVLRELRATTDELAERAVPTVVDLRETVETADLELERLHGVIDSAENVIDTAGHVSSSLTSASRAAARVVATPAIKGKAIAAGAGRAVRRLRAGS